MASQLVTATITDECSGQPPVGASQPSSPGINFLAHTTLTADGVASESNSKTETDDGEYQDALADLDLLTSPTTSTADDVASGDISKIPGQESQVDEDDEEYQDAPVEPPSVLNESMPPAVEKCLDLKEGIFAGMEKSFDLSEGVSVSVKSNVDDSSAPPAIDASSVVNEEMEKSFDLSEGMSVSVKSNVNDASAPPAIDASSVVNEETSPGIEKYALLNEGTVHGMEKPSGLLEGTSDFEKSPDLHGSPPSCAIETSPVLLSEEDASTAIEKSPDLHRSSPSSAIEKSPDLDEGVSTANEKSAILNRSTSPAIERTPGSSEGAFPTMEKCTVLSGGTSPAVEKFPILREGTTPAIEKSPILSEGTSPATEKPPVLSEGTSPATEKPALLSEGSSPATEKPLVLSEGRSPATQKPTVLSEGTSTAIEKSTLLCEGTSLAMERTSVLNEGTSPTTPNSPVVSEGTSPTVEKSPVLSEGASPAMEKSPVVSEGTSPTIEKSPVLSEGASPAMEKSPVVSEGTSPTIEKSPVLSEGASPAMEKSPVVSEGTSPTVEKSPVLSEGASPAMEKSPVVSEGTSPTIEKSPVLSEDTSTKEKFLVVNEGKSPETEKSPVASESASPAMEKSPVLNEGLSPAIEKTPILCEDQSPATAKCVSSEGPSVASVKSVSNEVTFPAMEKSPVLKEGTPPTMEKTSVLSENTSPATEKVVGNEGTFPPQEQVPVSSKENSRTNNTTPEEINGLAPNPTSHEACTQPSNLPSTSGVPLPQNVETLGDTVAGDVGVTESCAGSVLGNEASKHNCPNKPPIEFFSRRLITPQWSPTQGPKEAPLKTSKQYEENYFTSIVTFSNYPAIFRAGDMVHGTVQIANRVAIPCTSISFFCQALLEMETSKFQPELDTKPYQSQPKPKRGGKKPSSEGLVKRLVYNDNVMAWMPEIGRDELPPGFHTLHFAFLLPLNARSSTVEKYFVLYYKIMMGFSYVDGRESVRYFDMAIFTVQPMPALTSVDVKDRHRDKFGVGRNVILGPKTEATEKVKILMQLSSSVLEVGTTSLVRILVPKTLANMKADVLIYPKLVQHVALDIEAETYYFHRTLGTAVPNVLSPSRLPRGSNYVYTYKMIVRDIMPSTNNARHPQQDLLKVHYTVEVELKINNAGTVIISQPVVVIQRLIDGQVPVEDPKLVVITGDENRIKNNGAIYKKMRIDTKYNYPEDDRTRAGTQTVPSILDRLLDKHLVITPYAEIKVPSSKPKVKLAKAAFYSTAKSHEISERADVVEIDPSIFSTIEERRVKELEAIRQYFPDLLQEELIFNEKDFAGSEEEEENDPPSASGSETRCHVTSPVVKTKATSGEKQSERPKSKRQTIRLGTHFQCKADSSGENTEYFPECDGISHLMTSEVESKNTEKSTNKKKEKKNPTEQSETAKFEGTGARPKLKKSNPQSQNAQQLVPNNLEDSDNIKVEGATASRSQDSQDSMTEPSVVTTLTTLSKKQTKKMKKALRRFQKDVQNRGKTEIEDFVVKDEQIRERIDNEDLFVQDGQNRERTESEHLVVQRVQISGRTDIEYLVVQTEEGKAMESLPETQPRVGTITEVCPNLSTAENENNDEIEDGVITQSADRGITEVEDFIKDVQNRERTESEDLDAKGEQSTGKTGIEDLVVKDAQSRGPTDIEDLVVHCAQNRGITDNEDLIVKTEKDVAKDDEANNVEYISKKLPDGETITETCPNLSTAENESVDEIEDGPIPQSADRREIEDFVVTDDQSRERTDIKDMVVKTEEDIAKDYKTNNVECLSEKQPHGGTIAEDDRALKVKSVGQAVRQLALKSSGIPKSNQTINNDESTVEFKTDTEQTKNESVPQTLRPAGETKEPSQNQANDPYSVNKRENIENENIESEVNTVNKKTANSRVSDETDTRDLANSDKNDESETQTDCSQSQRLCSLAGEDVGNMLTSMKYEMSTSGKTNMASVTDKECNEEVFSKTQPCTLTSQATKCSIVPGTETSSSPVVCQDDASCRPLEKEAAGGANETQKNLDEEKAGRKLSPRRNRANRKSCAERLRHFTTTKENEKFNKEQPNDQKTKNIPSLPRACFLNEGNFKGKDSIICNQDQSRERTKARGSLSEEQGKSCAERIRHFANTKQDKLNSDQKTKEFTSLPGACFLNEGNFKGKDSIICNQGQNKKMTTERGSLSGELEKSCAERISHFANTKQDKLNREKASDQKAKEFTSLPGPCFLNEGNFKGNESIICNQDQSKEMTRDKGSLSGELEKSCAERIKHYVNTKEDKLKREKASEEKTNEFTSLPGAYFLNEANFNEKDSIIYNPDESKGGARKTGSLSEELEKSCAERKRHFANTKEDNLNREKPSDQKANELTSLPGAYFLNEGNFNEKDSIIYNPDESKGGTRKTGSLSEELEKSCAERKRHFANMKEDNLNREKPSDQKTNEFTSLPGAYFLNEGNFNEKDSIIYNPDESKRGTRKTGSLSEELEKSCAERKRHFANTKEDNLNREKLSDQKANEFTTLHCFNDVNVKGNHSIICNQDQCQDVTWKIRILSEDLEKFSAGLLRRFVTSKQDKLNIEKPGYPKTNEFTSLPGDYFLNDYDVKGKDSIICNQNPSKEWAKERGNLSEELEKYSDERVWKEWSERNVKCDRTVATFESLSYGDQDLQKSKNVSFPIPITHVTPYLGNIFKHENCMKYQVKAFLPNCYHKPVKVPEMSIETKALGAEVMSYALALLKMYGWGESAGDKFNEWLEIRCINFLRARADVPLGKLLESVSSDATSDSTSQSMTDFLRKFQDSKINFGNHEERDFKIKLIEDHESDITDFLRKLQDSNINFDSEIKPKEDHNSDPKRNTHKNPKLSKMPVETKALGAELMTYALALLKTYGCGESVGNNFNEWLELQCMYFLRTRANVPLRELLESVSSDATSDSTSESTTDFLRKFQDSKISFGNHEAQDFEIKLIEDHESDIIDFLRKLQDSDMNLGFEIKRKEDHNSDSKRNTHKKPKVSEMPIETKVLGAEVMTYALALLKMDGWGESAGDEFNEWLEMRCINFLQARADVPLGKLLESVSSGATSNSTSQSMTDFLRKFQDSKIRFGNHESRDFEIKLIEDHESDIIDFLRKLRDSKMNLDNHDARDFEIKPKEDHNSDSKGNTSNKPKLSKMLIDTKALGAEAMTDALALFKMYESGKLAGDEFDEWLESQCINFLQTRADVPLLKSETSDATSDSTSQSGTDFLREFQDSKINFGNHEARDFEVKPKEDHNSDSKRTTHIKPKRVRIADRLRSNLPPNVEQLGPGSDDITDTSMTTLLAVGDESVAPSTHGEQRSNDGNGNQTANQKNESNEIMTYYLTSTNIPNILPPSLPTAKSVADIGGIRYPLSREMEPNDHLMEKYLRKLLFEGETYYGKEVNTKTNTVEGLREMYNNNDLTDINILVDRYTLKPSLTIDSKESSYNNNQKLNNSTSINIKQKNTTQKLDLDMPNKIITPLGGEFTKPSIFIASNTLSQCNDIKKGNCMTSINNLVTCKNSKNGQNLQNIKNGGEEGVTESSAEKPCVKGQQRTIPEEKHIITQDQDEPVKDALLPFGIRMLHRPEWNPRMCENIFLQHTGIMGCKENNVWATDVDVVGDPDASTSKPVVLRKPFICRNNNSQKASSYKGTKLHSKNVPTRSGLRPITATFSESDEEYKSLKCKIRWYSSMMSTLRSKLKSSGWDFEKYNRLRILQEEVDSLKVRIKQLENDMESQTCVSSNSKGPL